MSATATTFLVSFSPILIGVFLGAMVSIIPIVIDTAKSNWKKRFRQQLRSAIHKEILTFEDMEHIAERWNQDRKAVLLSLRVLHSEALSGEDPELTKHCDAIRILLSRHQAREPYAELPENISLQLSRLSEISGTTDTIAQLASSLSELYSSNQREIVEQKKYSFWGFVIGIVGVLLSVPGLYISLRA
ncbi:hypothetical protein K4H28_14480 [Deefgea tanakiae]|uniref:Uncharacterized protein n=1 Tax=Deefgea tanakiae TaxID=2865840 RepID=A0ABX8Z4H4_9NEIS|nr:hypothetical protein [Deefgea tanakiae]QZA77471.1 hypothetical protein K4H28_14480 [Deefgea tanakiae]